MNPTRQRPRSRWAFALLVTASLGAAAGAQQMMPATRVDQKPTVIDAALALWNTGEYAGAIAEFEQSIAKDADNLALHARFARMAAGARWKTTELEQERKRAATEKEKPAAAPKPTAAGDKPATAAQYKPPPIKTDEELAAMAKTADAANKGLADLTALYERWMKERPTRAAYPYTTALLLDAKQEFRRVQLLLAAAALDPKLTEPYTELIALTSGYDDEAALKYARKALEITPDDPEAELTYVRMLWPTDQMAARSYYEALLKKRSGTKHGAAAIQQFIGAVEDPDERAALVERFRREYPNDWTPGHYANVSAFSALVQRDPLKGLVFAQEIRNALERSTPGAAEKALASDARMKELWDGHVDYAQAVVDARALVDEGKGSEALVRLEKVGLPGSVGKLPLEVLRAEATAASGDSAKAYDMLVVSLAADITQSAQKAILRIGATLGKSPKQIDDEIWARRKQKAETFKDFDLAKLGSTERVTLADLRGKVVLVDFWFPG